MDNNNFLNSLSKSLIKDVRLMLEGKKIDQDQDGDNDFDDVQIARYMAGGMSKKDAIAKAKEVKEKGVDETAINPYAVGMAAAKKSEKDTPPLKKSTIQKGHEIAKDIMAKEETEELDEAAFAPTMKKAITAHERGDHKMAKYHLDNAKTARYAMKSTEIAKNKDLLDKYKELSALHEGTERGTGTHSINKKHEKHDELVKAGFEHEAFQHKNGGTVHTYWSPGNRSTTLHRILGNISEEAEQVDEMKKAKMLKYLKANKKSDAEAQAKGDYSKSDRRMRGADMAVRKYTAKPGSKSVRVPATEEAEAIDEISNKTLSSYTDKAAKERDVFHADRNKTADAARRYFNRKNGVRKALNITKEEVELEESAKIAAHLIKRYGDNVLKSHVMSAANDFGVDPSKLAKAVRTKLGKTTLGEEIELTQEEIDNIEATLADLDEARGRPKKNAGADFTVNPITKEKLYHSNPEHAAKIEKLQKNGVIEKPKTEAAQHIINQLRKASTSMAGGATIHFTHGDAHHVAGTHAAKLLDKYAGMKPDEKEAFQKKIGHSHTNLKSEL